MQIHGVCIMKIAFISDIHSNLIALEEVLSSIGKIRTICLGDLVGYNPFPNEVVEIIKERKITCIMGNHDYAVLTGDVAWFNPIAAKAILWTRKILKKENFEFLGKLKTSFIEDGIYCVHGSPLNPLEEYVFPDYPTTLLKEFLRIAKTKIIAIGHTHMPFVRYLEDGIIFNAGSVGQPRDGDPRACYAVFDTKNENVEIVRVEYNIDKVAKEIVKAGLPRELALRLYKGW